MAAQISMMTPREFTAFPWLEYAFGEMGTRGYVGKDEHNPRVVMYHSCAGSAQDDEVAWCSAFVNWCMRRAQINGTGSPAARSWQTWGQRLADPVFGCVVVLTRPPKPWSGHVGFYVGTMHDKVLLLGGNQGNSVKLAAYPIARLISYRWPLGMQLPAERGPNPIPWSS